MKTKADEKLEKLGETKWTIMKELDSILHCKVPKDAEKKVMDQLQKFNWCIDMDDLAINKNLQKVLFPSDVELFSQNTGNTNNRQDQQVKEVTDKICQCKLSIMLR